MSIQPHHRAAVLSVVLVGLVPAMALAADKVAKQSKAKPSEQVEMFAAISSGDIEVKLIPRSDREARVLIKNKTNKPLSVKLPDAFAGVPVLGQVRGGGGGANSSQNQSMGGGMGGMGGGMGGMGGGMGGMGGGGMFNVAPEKVGEFKVATVCLEHGKKDPRAAIPYEIRPITSVSEKPEVRELLRLFGQGRLNQRATQAAAWILANGMSWEELASKQLEHADGVREPYFQPEEIQLAQRLVAMAEHQALQRASEEQPKSPGERAVSPGENKTDRTIETSR